MIYLVGKLIPTFPDHAPFVPSKLPELPRARQPAAAPPVLYGLDNGLTRVSRAAHGLQTGHGHCTLVEHMVQTESLKVASLTLFRR
jgi:hypothetical protein